MFDQCCIRWPTEHRPNHLFGIACGQRRNQESRQEPFDLECLHTVAYRFRDRLETAGEHKPQALSVRPNVAAQVAQRERNERQRRFIGAFRVLECQQDRSITDLLQKTQGAGKQRELHLPARHGQRCAVEFWHEVRQGWTFHVQQQLEHRCVLGTSPRQCGPQPLRQRLERQAQARTWGGLEAAVALQGSFTQVLTQQSRFANAGFTLKQHCGTFGQQGLGQQRFTPQERCFQQPLRLEAQIGHSQALNTGQCQAGGAVRDLQFGVDHLEQALHVRGAVGPVRRVFLQELHDDFLEVRGNCWVQAARNFGAFTQLGQHDLSHVTVSERGLAGQQSVQQHPEGVQVCTVIQ